MKARRHFLYLAIALALAAIPAFAQQSGADFYNAASAAMKKGDFDTAITDFTQAIVLMPGAVGTQAYISRGFAKMHKGDMNGALTDFNHAISLGGKADNAYYGRALVEQAQGALDAAIADYHQTLASAPPGGDNPHFYLWLARVQQNQKADADKELSDYIAKRPTTRKQDWQSKIGGFLLGQVTEANLATYALSFPNPADQSRAQCESWYFIGMKRQIAGEKDAAADDFRKCLGTNQTVLTQYVLAKAAAEALDLNPGQ